MHVSTTRQLTQNITGELTWVMGPQDSRSMALAFVRKGKRTQAVLRVEVS